MRKSAAALAFVAALALAACEKTGENEFEVQTPDVDVGSNVDTITTPDVDVQPARHRDAIEKMTTPDNRIWTCTQNTTDRWQDDAAGQISPDY